MKLIDEHLEKSFIYNYHKYLHEGIIKKFDGEFYRQFDGMYFRGLPIYYHLTESYMTNGHCYDASATLGLAFGKEAYVCRGNLRSLRKAWKGKTGHGWVEKGGYCYDTTWKIACPKNVYYKVFKPVKVQKRSHNQFFEDCKWLTDWTIRDKEWYEQNYCDDLLVIVVARNIAQLELEKHKVTPERRKFLEQLLIDLPDENKAEKPDIISMITNKTEECF